MYYSGESNVPGAPGNLMAGSPGYFMGDEEIQNRLFRHGMDNTPKGAELKQRMEQLRNQLFPLNKSIPLAQGSSGEMIPPGMGGAPGQTFNPKYLENLKQQGSPIPPGLREQLYPGTQPPMSPQAYGNGMGVYGSSTPMGNAGFFLGPQLGQQLPVGFQNKTLS